MSEKPELSIVIVSHGHEVMLNRCIGSLAPALAGVNAEIIVIDNLQARSVAPIVAPLGVRLIENDAPLGFAANVNRGAASASGARLLLLNPDMRHASGSLREALAFLDAHAEIGLLGCALLNDDGSPQQSYRKFPSLRFLLARGLGADRWPWRPSFYRDGLMEAVICDQPQPVDWVFGAFILVRKAEFERLGRMDEAFRLYYEDVDLCLRYRKAGLATAVYAPLKFFHTHMRASAKKPFSRTWRWHVSSAIRYFWKAGRLA